jgi:hypothetical protein
LGVSSATRLTARLTKPGNAMSSNSRICGQNHVQHLRDGSSNRYDVIVPRYIAEPETVRKTSEILSVKLSRLETDKSKFGC